jgi:hypothetical protein
VALTTQQEAILRSLAARGDSFARHVFGMANARDSMLLKSLAARGDLFAVRHLEGAETPAGIEGQLEGWAARGDTMAVGILSVVGGDRTPQVITFAQPAGKTFGDAPFALTGSGGSSSQPVRLSVASGPGTLNGSTLTLTGAGSVVVAANQDGDENYEPAAEVTRTITVAKATQVIVFDPPASIALADGAIHLTAESSSGLAPTFALVSGPATLVGGLLTPTGAGAVVVTASQAGNANYLAASPVEKTITVTGT